ncbi:OmpA family protein [uncultured Nonlabens sp.]|uniref:OmpA family protein n=1 Tax=uncultured Nonlabens sp. TaxID=859306 RepID=UPI0030D9E649|tara:strand:+ start:22122 stop:23990 length:1869 start_codon:yes stop_codon:yes gene_type:complete
MKKLYILLILFVGVAMSAQAQTDKTAKADKLYEQLRYVDAAEAYEKLIKNGVRTQHVYTQLGDSYFYNSDFKNAEKNYARAIKNDPQVETLYRYAQSLKASQKYDLSNTIMNQFASLKPGDDRAKEYKSNPNYINDILGMKVGFTTKSHKFNTEASDFSALQVGSKLYFSSARNENRGKYGWNKEPYLDIYEAIIDDAGVVGKPELVNGEVNTKYHEGTLDITPDGKYMFFTRVDYYKGDYEKAVDGESKLNIYRALNAGGEWRDVATTSLESKEYGVGHPSITKDGKSIYFASQAPDGLGGTDIYKADLKDGVISNPVNLGPSVNTAGDDSFPYIADDNTLYFSSNGHLGLGGLDVFKYTDGQVTNMGSPVNSSLDDFGFSYSEATGKGYVSSNRDGGQGGDDVYGIERIEICEVAVSVTAVDAKTGMPIPGAIVSLQDGNNNTMPGQTTDANGKAVFTTDCNLELTARGAKDKYESGEATLSVAEEETAMVEVLMVPEPEIVEDKIILNKIYFDLDNSDIRPDAALELDRLVGLMKKYPTLEILAETYADIRGSDDYNLALTERRSESIIKYVASQGVDASRLTAAGRGEANPMVDCASKKCTSAEYELSRRSEFTITKR